MIRCQQCNTDNLDHSEYCDECGQKLTANANVRAAATPVTPTVTAVPPAPPQFVSTPQFTPQFAKDAVTPKAATPYHPAPASAGQPLGGNSVAGSQIAGSQMVGGQIAGHHRTSGTLRQNNSVPATIAASVAPTVIDETPEAQLPMVRAKLVIQRGGKVGKEFVLTADDSLIGRWDADGGIFPDVDLDQDDPEAKVSRRHARIHWLNNQFLIEDLGSTNGTFVNRGPRLLPGNRQPLKNGDEVIVGKTFLKFVAS